MSGIQLRFLTEYLNERYDFYVRSCTSLWHNLRLEGEMLKCLEFADGDVRDERKNSCAMDRRVVERGLDYGYAYVEDKGLGFCYYLWN